MAVEPAPYFEVHLEHQDGTQIPRERFRTVQDSMAFAEALDGVAGAIFYLSEAGADPVEVIVYNADGTIAAGAGVPDDEFEDEPWTEAEIAANKAEAARYRASRGI